ncbi:unnamed protein product, partial [Discosporangium mesarthrocarpum]
LKPFKVKVLFDRVWHCYRLQSYSQSLKRGRRIQTSPNTNACVIYCASQFSSSKSGIEPTGASGAWLISLRFFSGHISSECSSPILWLLVRGSYHHFPPPLLWILL